MPKLTKKHYKKRSAKQKKVNVGAEQKEFIKK